MPVAAATGSLDRRGRWALGAAVVALPWLAVKYVLVYPRELDERPRLP